MIKYIQFRSDIVIPGSGPNRSFNAWTPEKHGDHCQPEETPQGVTLHEIKTETVYVKGVAIKEQKRTGRSWHVPVTAVGYITKEEDKTKAKA